MIETTEEYARVKEQLRLLESRLDHLQREYPVPAKGLTKAGVRKMIARLHEELAVYEGSQELRQPEPSP